MERYVCVHGHFYQPPRENPWLEAIEIQDSAYPYHDWNERITAECYAPNAASRILDGEDRIVEIVNNYARISFNFGPTLLSWLEEKAADVYRSILAADKQSQELFSGHGSAMAQVYNHIIMPLANRRDKLTQIRWGLADFERRFGRKAEGMWLPETAVDLESLDLMAEEGLRFTVLSPHQARRARRVGGRSWRDVQDGRVDPSRAYRIRLPSGRSMALFFYDGPISRGVAFEGLLKRGEDFANRLAQGFSDSRDWPQLVHIATDGETYGHHHPRGEMALAYTLKHIEAAGLAKITNYSEYLERHPPAAEVEIIENSSWSCVHGVERWRSHCGCNSGSHPSWHQDWRAPLREAFDWLRDELAPRYELCAARLLKDPWSARDHYIDLILDRSPESVRAFLEKEATHPLGEVEETQALKLLEMQRHAMLMYTSCGWFFDELSGIETVQVIQYAGRALQLSEQSLPDGLQPQLLERLGKAKSNLSDPADGRGVYEKFVRPAMVDLEKVGVHYAVSSLFEPYGPEARIYCYTIAREDHSMPSAGRARLSLGRARITSDLLHDHKTLIFGAIHLGDHNLRGGVREFDGLEAYAKITQELSEVFGRGDFPEVIRVLDRDFGSQTSTLQLLFRDEQRRILRFIMESALAEAEAAYRHLFDHHAPLLRFLANLNLPRPKAFQIAAEFTLNADLRRAFGAETLDFDRIRAWLDEAGHSGITLDEPTLEFALRTKIEKSVKHAAENPEDVTRLQALADAAGLARSLPFSVNLWAAQNYFVEVLKPLLQTIRARAEQGDASAQSWLGHYPELGAALRILME